MRPEQERARREPITPVVPRLTLTRLRSWATTAAGLGLLACWGLPWLQHALSTASSPAVARLGAIPLLAGPAAWAQRLQPVAISLAGLAAVLVVADWWASRQRRRVIGQVARLVRVRQTETILAHVWPGVRAPLRARVYLPAGYALENEQLDQVAELISRAWGYVYRVAVTEQHDVLRLRRAWRCGLDSLDAAEAGPDDPLQARLEQLRPEIPHLDVDAITPTERDADTGAVREFELTYQPKFDLSAGPLAGNLSRSLATMAGAAVPEGHKLQVSWEPERDRAYVRVAEALPSYVDHPLIGNYAEHLGTDRLVLPYGTADYGRTLWWDLDYRSPTPHGLISGKTGSGKTTFLRAVIAQGLARGIPWLLLDPKQKEFVEFAGLPGVLAVLTQPEEFVDAITLLQEEEQQRYRVGARDRLDDHEYPLLGMVYDEWQLLAFMLQRLARRDKHVRELDPLGAATLMFSSSRGAGFRKLVATQRADSNLFGSGLPRLNLGMRLAMQRGDDDSDRMMFNRVHVTDTLDQTVPGRGIGTLPNGDPAEVQVWRTPKLDQHPKVRAKMSPADRALADALVPDTAPDPGLFLPAHRWTALTHTPSESTPANEPATPTDEVAAPAPMVEASEPDRDGHVWDLANLDMTRAGALQPQQRILADLDGALVPATVLDDDRVDDRVDLDLRLDSGQRQQLAGVEADELLPLLS